MPVSRAYIEALITRLEPRMKRAFMDAIYDWRRHADLDGIARALERGDVPAAIKAANIQPAALNGITKAMEASFEAAGAAEMSGLRLPIIFNVRDLRAERILREAAAMLVKGATQDQVAMLRSVLTDGLARGQGGRATALNLVGRNIDGVRQGGYIGLTESQARWALNYEAELSDPARMARALTRKLRDKRFDATVRKAIKDGKPLGEAQIGKMVTAYRNRALRCRGETIARTETLRAVNAGRFEAYQQAVDAGRVAEQNIRRVWNATLDNRVRDTHRDMDGQSVGLNEDFESPSGARLRYPCDESAPIEETINCRCNVSYRIDHLANIS